MRNHWGFVGEAWALSTDGICTMLHLPFISPASKHPRSSFVIVPPWETGSGLRLAAGAQLREKPAAVEQRCQQSRGMVEQKMVSCMKMKAWMEKHRRDEWACPIKPKEDSGRRGGTHGRGCCAPFYPYFPCSSAAPTCYFFIGGITSSFKSNGGWTCLPVFPSRLWSPVFHCSLVSVESLNMHHPLPPLLSAALLADHFEATHILKRQPRQYVHP